MGWSITEDLLCVADDGSVSVYDIHGGIKKTVTMGQVSQYKQTAESSVTCSKN